MSLEAVLKETAMATRRWPRLEVGNTRDYAQRNEACIFVKRCSGQRIGTWLQKDIIPCTIMWTLQGDKDAMNTGLPIHVEHVFKDVRFQQRRQHDYKNVITTRASCRDC